MAVEDLSVEGLARTRLAKSVLDAGWSGIVTVDSGVRNVNAAGEDRVNIQSADENALAAVRGISPELAKAIVGYRWQNRFENIADLLDVTPPLPPNQPVPPQNAPAGQTTPGQPQPAQPGTCNLEPAT